MPTSTEDLPLLSKPVLGIPDSFTPQKKMQFLIGLGSWGLFCFVFSRLERTWKWFKWLLLLQTGKIRTITTEQRRCPGLWGADSPSAKVNSWRQGMLLLQVGTSQHLKAEDFYGKTISMEMNREWLFTVSTKSRRSHNKINGSQVAFLHTMCRILWELEVYLASKKCLNKFIGKKKSPHTWPWTANQGKLMQYMREIPCQVFAFGSWQRRVRQTFHLRWSVSSYVYLFTCGHRI